MPNHTHLQLHQQVVVCGASVHPEEIEGVAGAPTQQLLAAAPRADRHPATIPTGVPGLEGNTSTTTSTTTTLMLLLLLLQAWRKRGH